MTEKREKKDTQVAAHMSASLRVWLKRVSERSALSESEYIERLLLSDRERLREEFEFMKSLFDADQ